MIRLEKQGEVFVLTMAAGENRWNTTFVRAFDEALGKVEVSEGPAALVTASDDEKFFSNGLDLEWFSSKGEHPGGDRELFAKEAMALFARMITLPMPTVCAVNGHAFGAGFMIALCHDIRVMREDRGYLCANEVELGFTIPEPELSLFRHKIPMDAFFQTVLLARRWTAPDALETGIVQHIAAKEAVRDKAIETAAGLTRLAKNRKVLGWMKEHIYGENAAINNVHGPAFMLRNESMFQSNLN
jgi:enoyl-CoA hydratase/carnithine racemase